MAEPILIDAGPSRYGWSSLEAFARCERLYFLTRVLPQREGVDLPTGPTKPIADPLIRGQIGHVGLAHEYARRYCARHGQDPDLYYDRGTAMRLLAEKHGAAGKAQLEIVEPVVDGYFAYYDAREVLDVVAIESEVAATLADGKLITQRLDLVIRDLNGYFWIYDHKIVADPLSVTRYTLSGQFLLMHHFGRAFYGAQFGGIRLNMLGVRLGYHRLSPEPAPAALACFASFVVELRSRIAAREGQGRAAYLPAFNEQICVSSYGVCPMFSLCQWELR
jgi:PD-(D/E)XK nuclease superfamily